MKDIEIIRNTTEEIAVKFPCLAAEFRKKGVVATVTLFSKRAQAQSYEQSNGVCFFVGGSRSLFDRFAASYFTK